VEQWRFILCEQEGQGFKSEREPPMQHHVGLVLNVNAVGLGVSRTCLHVSMRS